MFLAYGLVWGRARVLIQEIELFTHIAHPVFGFSKRRVFPFQGRGILESSEQLLSAASVGGKPPQKKQQGKKGEHPTEALEV